MNSKKDIVVNSLWMVFDKVFILLLNLFVTVKVANYFGTTEYGTYQYAISVVALIEIFVNVVDGRVVKKYYSSIEPEKLVFNSTISRIYFSVLSLIAGVIIVLTSNRGNLFSVVFLILLFNMILTNLRFGMANRFEYLLMSKRVVIAADISAFISSILQLSIIYYGGNLIHISIVALISTIVNITILTIQYRIEFQNNKLNKVDGGLIFLLIKESLPLVIAAGCATIYQRCDSVMIGNMLSVGDVGIYSISLKLINVVQIAISPIRESVYPKLIQLYGINQEKYANTYIKISSLLTWIYIIGVISSYIILPYAFKFLNDEYALAFPVYKIYVIGTLFMYNAALRAGHYTLINKGKILTYTQVASVIMNVILNYALIKYLGIYGAAISTCVTQCMSLMISNLFFGEEGKKVFIWQLKAFNPVNIFIN